MSSVWADSVGFFRDRFAEVFEDSCTIVRTTSRGTFSTVTGRYSTPSDATKYTGACQIRPSGQGSEEERAEAEVVTGRYDLRIPYDTDDIEPDDLVTCTASTYDTGLVGKTFRVIDPQVDTFDTHRLITIEINWGRGNP